MEDVVMNATWLARHPVILGTGLQPIFWYLSCNVFFIILEGKLTSSRKLKCFWTVKVTNFIFAETNVLRGEEACGSSLLLIFWEGNKMILKFAMKGAEWRENSTAHWFLKTRALHCKYKLQQTIERFAEVKFFHNLLNSHSSQLTSGNGRAKFSFFSLNYGFKKKNGLAFFIQEKIGIRRSSTADSFLHRQIHHMRSLQRSQASYFPSKFISRVSEL